MSKSSGRLRVLGIASAVLVLTMSSAALAVESGATGEGTVAAKRFVVKKLNQIKPKVRKQLKKTPNNSVTLDKLAPDAVDSSKIVDNSVTLDKLAPDAVDSSKIVDNSVTAADIDLSTIAAFWRRGGNAGTDSANDFIGTTDAEPLVLRTNDAVALRLEPASDGTNQSPNVIAGMIANAVTDGTFGATISGGGQSTPNDAASANRVTDDHGTVGGGADNQAGDAIGTTSDARNATVGGGRGNSASGSSATVAGGLGNVASGSQTTVGGGQSNDATSTLAGVGAGFANDATGVASTIAGGQVNDATGFEAFLGGGQANAAGGARSVIGGGFTNVVTADGNFATIAGGNNNTAAGDFSFVAGRRGKNSNAAHNGVFLFADSTNADIASTGPNQFIARASGGFFLQDDSSLDDQGGFLNTSTGAHLTAGGAWTDSSDANLKRGFERIAPRSVLARVAALPISSWSYTSEPGVRHLGPTAQDFHRAFGLGADDRHIASLDANGVSLAAIKALQAENRGLSERLGRLEARLRRLER